MKGRVRRSRAPLLDRDEGARFENRPPGFSCTSGSGPFDAPDSRRPLSAPAPARTLPTAAVPVSRNWGTATGCQSTGRLLCWAEWVCIWAVICVYYLLPWLTVELVVTHWWSLTIIVITHTQWQPPKTSRLGRQAKLGNQSPIDSVSTRASRQHGRNYRAECCVHSCCLPPFSPSKCQCKVVLVILQESLHGPGILWSSPSCLIHRSDGNRLSWSFSSSKLAPGTSFHPRGPTTGSCPPTLQRPAPTSSGKAALCPCSLIRTPDRWLRRPIPMQICRALYSPAATRSPFQLRPRCHALEALIVPPLSRRPEAR